MGKRLALRIPKSIAVESRPCRRARTSGRPSDPDTCRKSRTAGLPGELPRLARQVEPSDRGALWLPQPVQVGGERLTRSCGTWAADPGAAAQRWFEDFDGAHVPDLREIASDGSRYRQVSILQVGPHTDLGPYAGRAEVASRSSRSATRHRCGREAGGCRPRPTRRGRAGPTLDARAWAGRSASPGLQRDDEVGQPAAVASVSSWGTSLLRSMPISANEARTFCLLRRRLGARGEDGDSEPARAACEGGAELCRAAGVVGGR